MMHNPEWFAEYAGLEILYGIRGDACEYVRYVGHGARSTVQAFLREPT